MPAEGGNPVPAEYAEKIMHISLPVSKETMIMGSDTGGEWSTGFSAGNNFSISITTDSKENADKYFYGLSEGGQVTMPINSVRKKTYNLLFINNLVLKSSLNKMEVLFGQ
jgi:PhnB protein